METGCGLALDKSTQTKSECPLNVEQSIASEGGNDSVSHKDVKSKGEAEEAEEATITQHLTASAPWSEDLPTSSSSSDEDYGSEEAQSFIRLANLNDRELSQLPTDEHIIAHGGEVYTWSWEDMMQCPLLAETVRHAGILAETETIDINTAAESSGLVSIMGSPAKPKVPTSLQEKTSSCIAKSFPENAAVFRGEFLNRDNLGSSGYWSAGSLKSERSGVKNEIRPYHLLGLTTQNESSNLLNERKLRESGSALNNFLVEKEQLEIRTLSEDDLCLHSTPSDQTIKNVKTFQNCFFTTSSLMDKSREPSRDSLESVSVNEIGKDTLPTPRAGYTNVHVPVQNLPCSIDLSQEPPYEPHLIQDQQNNILKPLKSSTSVPSVNSGSSLVCLTISRSENRMLSSSSFQNPILITVTPPYPSTWSSSVDIPKQSTNVSLHGIHDDSIEFLSLSESKSHISLSDHQDVLPVPSAAKRACNMLSILPTKIGSPSESNCAAPQKPPQAGFSCQVKKSSSESDSISAILSPYLKEFLKTDPSQDDTPSEWTEDEDLPQDCDSVELDMEYSPWSCIVTHNPSFPQMDSELNSPTLENVVQKIESSADSQTNIAGVRYGGRYVVPGNFPALIDGPHFQKQVTHESVQGAGATVPAPDLPIAGFKYIITEEKSSESQINLKQQVAPMDIEGSSSMMDVVEEDDVDVALAAPIPTPVPSVPLLALNAAEIPEVAEYVEAMEPETKREEKSRQVKEVILSMFPCYKKSNKISHHEC